MSGAAAPAGPVDEGRILAIVGRHRHRDGPLLEILHEVQATFGCVPAAAVPVIARALNLSRADVQASWHQWTGYLPITRAAYELTRSNGFYDRNPGTDISIRQMTLNPPTMHSRGLRLGSFVVIRDIIQDELEQAFSGKKSAQAALDDAVRRGNIVLRQFEKNGR